MTYSITNTSGSTTYSINDSTVNQNDTDLTFIGRGYNSYGSALNTNFLRVLENFANTSAPTKPIMGQLWYDSLNGQLKVYNGSSFVAILANSSAGNARGESDCVTITVSSTGSNSNNIPAPSLSLKTPIIPIV